MYKNFNINIGKHETKKQRNYFSRSGGLLDQHGIKINLLLILFCKHI